MKQGGFAEAFLRAGFGRNARLERIASLIDATLVEAAVRCPPRSARPAGGGESRPAQDPDASWTRVDRGRRLFFGYKVHVGVDLGSGLIRSRQVTPARTCESKVADDLVPGDERAVYADKAYGKRARREALGARDVKDRIQHRRVRGQPVLPCWQAVRNKLIGRIRGAVERTFFRTRARLLWPRQDALSGCATEASSDAAFRSTSPPSPVICDVLLPD